MLMPTLEALTSSLGGWILIKSTLVLILALIASGILAKGSAATRHYVWTLTFVSMLVLPIAVRASFQESKWRISVPVLTPTPMASAAAGPAPAPRPSPSPFSSPVTGQERSSSTPSTRATTIPWWQALWLAGSGLFFARLALGLLVSYRAKKRSVALIDDSWLELLESARERMSVRRPVRLALAAASSMPITLGVWRPSILLPASSERYPASRRSAVLLHELAHVRRQDCLTQWICQTVCALFWWHPLVWLGARQMRALSERASDDLVLEAGTRPTEYAHELLDIARGLNLRGSFAPLASVTMAHRSRLEERLLAVLDEGMSRGSLRTRHALSGAIAGVAIVASIALAVPTAASLPATKAQTAEPEPRQEPEPTPEPEPRQEPDSTPRDNDAAVRARAALAGALDDPDASVREQALHALVEIGDDSAIPYLDEALRSGTADMREEAAWALGRMRREESVEGLIAALSDESDAVRAEAAWALGMIRSDAATEALVRGLGDESAEVREQAAWACGMIRSSASIDGLIASLSDDVEDVRSEAAWALGMIRDRRALDGLATAVDDPSDDVREQAIWAVGMLRSPQSTDVLVAALRDPSADVRTQAAWALGMLRDSRAIDALSEALEDESADVREQAAWALGRIAGGGDSEVDIELDLDVDLKGAIL